MNDMAMYYTGVGSRLTPFYMLERMKTLATHLEKEGYTLRSGGAVGADTAFYDGVVDKSLAHVFRPHHIEEQDCGGRAMKIASMLHPNWKACKPFVRLLHARNVFQIMGFQLNQPSEFVVCWTPDGVFETINCTRSTGGTGMAIRVANRYGIPVYNWNHTMYRTLSAVELLETIMSDRNS